MDKKSKDALRRYKKSRQHTQSSSDSSSSGTDTGSSSSYSSSDTEHNRSSDRHRKKKSIRRGNSTSGDDRRKREKREHCQKRLELVKRNHLKRKLKMKKRAAAAAAAALGGHGHRALSPATQAKLKKLAERKHARATSKERREREREKLRAVQRERDREHHRLGSRSPPTTTKIRIHQDVKRQKSPGMGNSSSSSSRMHHQMMSREKIIIQARTRDRTPSNERERERERQRHEHKIQRHDELALRERERRDRERERAEREAARDKERAEALARCQERQRERERIAREKMRREEEEKKYGNSGGGSNSGVGNVSERLLGSRQAQDRDLDMSAPYDSRERSLEAVDRSRHVSKRDIDVYEQHEYLEAERRRLLEEMRRERGYFGAAAVSHRRRDISPVADHYAAHIRDPRDLFNEDERERAFKRAYLDETRVYPRERDAWLDGRELRERELHDHRDFREMDDADLLLSYPDERERLIRERERNMVAVAAAAVARAEWKNDWDREWEDNSVAGGMVGGISGPNARGVGFVGGPKRIGIPKIQQQQQQAPQQNQGRAGSEPEWDLEDQDNGNIVGGKAEPNWMEIDQREKLSMGAGGRPWQGDWREPDDGFLRPTSGGSGSGGMGVEPGQMHHQPQQQQTPTHHHHHQPRSERGGRGFRRGGGSHIDHMGERNPQAYRPHPPPLMTLPVQPPGGFHGMGSGAGINQRGGYPHKRMTYTNPNFLKKPMHPHMHQQHSSTPQHHQQQQQSQQQSSQSQAAKSTTAQASAVAAATTAVAAAKAAAQSAANATTNPGILAQVSKSNNSNNHNNSNNNGSNDTETISEMLHTKLETAPQCDDAILKKNNDNNDDDKLSEISDSDDDILNKTDKVKPKTELSTDGETTTLISSSALMNNDDPINRPIDSLAVFKVDDDEVLDFEEISDGELEEDGRHKGIGDALGVDWQGLIAETRRQAAECATPNDNEAYACGKQRWQPHRIILDVGISLRMAGASYAQQLLNESKQQLQAERTAQQQIQKQLIKTEIKSETNTCVNNKQPPAAVAQQTQQHIKSQQQQFEDAAEPIAPLACVQVALRRQQYERQKLITNVCGINSRALSARQDIKLRRQLCGLPAREYVSPDQILPEVNTKLKTMALAIFQQSLDVK